MHIKEGTLHFYFLKGAGHSAPEFPSVILSQGAFDALVYLKHLPRKLVFLTIFFLCTLLIGCLFLNAFIIMQIFSTYTCRSVCSSVRK